MDCKQWTAFNPIITDANKNIDGELAHIVAREPAAYIRDLVHAIRTNPNDVADKLESMCE